MKLRFVGAKLTDRYEENMEIRFCDLKPLTQGNKFQQGPIHFENKPFSEKQNQNWHIRSAGTLFTDRQDRHTHTQTYRNRQLDKLQ